MSFSSFEDFTQNLKNFIWLRDALKHEVDSNRASLTLVKDAVVVQHSIGHGILVDADYVSGPPVFTGEFDPGNLNSASLIRDLIPPR